MFASALILFALFFGLIIAHFAGQRGRGILGWYAAGVLLGPIALVVLMVPRQKHEPEALFNGDRLR